jgi:methionyl-tRNA synthetase
LTEFKKWWPPVHVIGKDIMIPAHGVYWPIMLKALGFADDEIPPLLVHGWWNIAGAKMSKSVGNIIDPDALADKYGTEAVRYYLLSDIATGRDADFSEERLVQRYNTDLANSLGNLLNRTLNMAWKYNKEGKLAFSDKGGLRDRAEYFAKVFAMGFESFETGGAISQAISLAVAANQYIEQMAPWRLAKEPQMDWQLNNVLYHLAESLRIIAILISPVLPKAAAGIFAQLNWDKSFRLEDTTWGGLPDGHQLGKPVPLFPRIETEGRDGSLSRPSKPAAAGPEGVGTRRPI